VPSIGVEIGENGGGRGVLRLSVLKSEKTMAEVVCPPVEVKDVAGSILFMSKSG
jgi:hypothetical protein